MKWLDKYRGAIAAHLDTSAEHIALFWKGRVGLYAILQAYGIKAGDEVIIPGFTCVVVPNAIIYCGATPIYVDIDPQTYCTTPEAIALAVTPNTRMVICQNTFGIAPDVPAIKAALAHRPDIAIVEDCTHGFGGTSYGRPHGTIADASFYSSQWNKPFSTGVGGFTYAKSAAIARALQTAEKRYAKPALRTQMQLLALVMARAFVGNGWLYWKAVDLYRWLSTKGMVVGSSADEELRAPIKPDNYEMQLGSIQAMLGCRALKELEQLVAARRTHIAAIDAELVRRGMQPPTVPHQRDRLYIRYPVRVSSKAATLREARIKHISLGDWFVSPIHPVEANWQLWKYQKGTCPVAEDAALHVVNVPTDTDLKFDWATVLR